MGTQVVEFVEALELVLHHAQGLRAPPAETVALLDSAGRVLAADVVADRDQPPFDRATRDGFAVPAGRSPSARRPANACASLRWWS